MWRRTSRRAAEFCDPGLIQPNLHSETPRETQADLVAVVLVERHVGIVVRVGPAADEGPLLEPALAKILLEADHGPELLVVPGGVEAGLQAVVLWQF